MRRLTLIIVIWALVLEITEKYGKTDAERADCTFPTHWIGIWFQFGIYRPIMINSTHIQTKGECVLSDSNIFLLQDRSENCYKLLMIDEKHPHVLQYKESNCRMLFYHQSYKDVINDKIKKIEGPLYTLFRSEPRPEPEACPFYPAPFNVTYNRGSGECSNPLSRAEYMSPGTHESRMLLQYMACPNVSNSESNVEELVCLASWNEGSTSYLVGQIFPSHGINPDILLIEDKYRCFIYKSQDNGVEKTYDIVRSLDATCSGLTFAEGINTMKFSTRADCIIPTHWNGKWFESGIYGPIIINSTHIQTWGECVLSDSNIFLLHIRGENCYKCLIIDEKHPHVLQYKESTCDRMVYDHQSLKDILNDRREKIEGPLYTLFRREPRPEPEACPFRPAPFNVTYNRGSGECSNPLSRAEYMSPGTHESRMLLQYMACPNVSNSESNVEELVCLASWNEGSTRYLVGQIFPSHERNSNILPDDDIYRCFIYKGQDNGVEKTYDIVRSLNATCSGLTFAEGINTMKFSTRSLSVYPDSNNSTQRHDVDEGQLSPEQITINKPTAVSSLPTAPQSEPQTSPLSTTTKPILAEDRKEVLTNQMDEYDFIGKNVAAKLRSFSGDQKIIAEKLINDVLFYGRLNQLSLVSRVRVLSGEGLANTSNVQCN